MSTATLLASVQPLAERYDVALLDLDGVVYVGEMSIDGAPQSLAGARKLGMRLAFVTNNASRPPAAVAAHLTRLGIAAQAADVITSAHAAAHHLADLLPTRSRVLVIGACGLVEAVRERGLVPVSSADDEPAAVVQGYSPDTGWRMLAEGAVAIRRGLPWIATNLDITLPSPRGPLPGNGSMVAALRHATGATPVSTGKPDPTMHRETVERSGARHPLVVGDRLDTDIEGANAVGCDSVLVLSGVTTPGELLAARSGRRPGYIAEDLRGLLTPHPAPTEQDGAMTCGGWSAAASGQRIRLAGGAADAHKLDALRALCTVAWHTGLSRCTPADDAAQRVLVALGLG